MVKKFLLKLEKCLNKIYIYGIIKLEYQKYKGRRKNMKKIITIEGMSCEHCKNRVETVLKQVEGVANAKVNLKEKKATVSIKDNVSDDLLKEAVKEAGFNPVSVEIKKGIFQ